MHFLKRWAALWLCGLLIMLAGCDSAPGPESLALRPPVLSDFAFSPQRVVFDELPPSQINGDEVEVPVEISVIATGPDRPVDRVEYVIQTPFSSTSALLTGIMTSAGGNRYTASATISISADEIANYTVVVYAVDTDSRLSGEARGQIRYTRTFEQGDPPVIDAIEAPDTVTRPAAGEPATTLSIVAVVSDPDGLNNIQRVEFWNVNTPNNKIPLCDDGGDQPCGVSTDSGDEMANDGRYTRVIFITSTNTPGVNTFAFQATDRSGLTSEIVQKQITVQ
ncbi:MAG TPA: hypothetical protein VKP65_07305 [Rhodothermales bacterium]|nr:hypothetical protein [Rhodothermales bacterium]